MISKLNKKDAFVGYRESKLTRILQPYLGGNSITAIICAVSPLLSNHQESINTLRFAMCAGGIKNDVKVNVKENAKPACVEEMKEALRKGNAERDSLIEVVGNQRASIERMQEEISRKKQEIEAHEMACQEVRAEKEKIVRMKEEKEEVLRKGSEDLEK